MTGNEEKRGLNLLKRIGFALAVVVLFFGFTEVIVRTLYPGLIRALPFWQFANPHLEQPAMYDHDPVLFWKLKAGNLGYEVNSQGFRGPLVDKKKKPGEFRVICFGDSCTFGVGPKPVSWRQTYPAKLQELLTEALPEKKITVLNFGCPGYTSFQGRWLLRKKGLAYKPDAITAYFGINDIIPALGFTDGDQRPMVDPPAALLPFMGLLKRLYAYEIMVRSIYGARLKITPVEDVVERVPEKDYLENLNDMKLVGEENGFSCYFIQPPYLEKDGSMKMVIGYEHDPGIDIFTPFENELKMGGNPLFGPPDNVHPTPEGHAVIAKTIFDRLMIDKPWER